MLTLKFIQANKEEVIEGLKKRNFDAEKLVDEIIMLDDKRKSLQYKTDTNQSLLKKKSTKIGTLYKEGNTAEAEKIKQETLSLKKNISQLSATHNECLKKIDILLQEIPNIPHISVPFGKNEKDNVIVKSGGNIPKSVDNLLPHWEITEKLDIIDFELGTKITGSGFPLYKEKGAALQRALINLFLNENINAGYKEILPPLVVNEDSAFGTGQLPDKEGQMYHIQSDNFYLIPTSEVPVTNIYRDVILSENELPQKLTAYSSCFRREAGSYGKNVRGLNRIHQFDKVEIVQITHPDNSYNALDEMVNHVENIVKLLELPYRIAKLSGADLGFTSALTFDFEVYAAAQKKWLEVSSVSNFLTFQANRLSLRFKNKNGATELAHTLNGSALALPRIVATLLENNQTSDGIKIPKALQKYTGFNII